jgi:uncharacterized membrane protein
MFGLTTIGLIHTAISLIAVAAGFLALVRDKEISARNRLGHIYIVTTVLTCLTGFFIFQHGRFGAPHALGIVTLIVLGVAWIAGYTPFFGRFGRYVETLSYSLTLFFHMIPAFTETSTRLPVGAPLASSPEDPALKAAIGIVFLVFLAGAAAQMLRLRASRRSKAT